MQDNDEGERKIRQLISTLDMRKDEALERTFKGVAKNFRDIFATVGGLRRCAGGHPVSDEQAWMPPCRWKAERNLERHGGWAAVGHGLHGCCTLHNRTPPSTAPSKPPNSWCQAGGGRL